MTMIITLIGSSKFEPYFHVWNEVLTLSGHLVFGLSTYPSVKQSREWYTVHEKRILDHVHKQKIDASSAVLLLNVDAYIGESTLSELQHAHDKRKNIYALESWGRGCGVWDNHTDAARAHKRKYGISDDYMSPVDTSKFLCVWNLLPEAGAFRSKLVDRVRSLGAGE